MILHTPRRRISPRTRRRYRAIREFFRRALGSSQPDIKINSSIAINVTDLKRKIVGLEHQLDEVTKQCRDYVYLDSSSRKDFSVSSNPSSVKRAIKTINEQTGLTTNSKVNGVDTNVIYKADDYQNEISENDFKSPVKNYNLPKLINEYNERVPKVKKSKLLKVPEDKKLYNYKAQSVHRNFGSANSTSSFRSLTIPRLEAINDEFHHKARCSKAEYVGSAARYKEKKARSYSKPTKAKYDDYEKYKKNRKNNQPDFDPDFITDIIRRQYKPLKMFGRRTSDISQFSAPVCRDQEYSRHNYLQEDTELCSCCYSGRLRKNMKSVCDTRLYSSKRQFPPTHHRINGFNHDSDMYDLVPVKEKSSPKSRRKFAEDSILANYAHHREVPPSPRSNRPRLNLKAQYHTDFEDFSAFEKFARRRVSPNHRLKKQASVTENPESDITSISVPLKKNNPNKLTRNGIQLDKQDKRHQDLGISQTNDNAKTSNGETHHKTDGADKTDKTLTEIKDILQSFLQEIKKEATGQCDKSDRFSKSGDNIVPDNSTRTNNNNVPNCPLGQFPSFLTPGSLLNACNYPILPVCSFNCPAQNSFIRPTPSHICTHCVSAQKDPQCEQCHKISDNAEAHNPETEKLIKEIHKFVAQGAIIKNENERKDQWQKSNFHKAEYIKCSTSRSIGRSSLPSRHDVKVGTIPLQCHSKSCEAMGTKSSYMSSPWYLNPSYSDTVIEKIGLGVSRSTMETQSDSIPARIVKGKPNRFQKVLNSFGIFKKKKKESIDELSESTIDMTPRLRNHSYDHVPHRQETTNYMMHGQEFFRPPPVGPHHHKYHPEFHSPYNTRVPGYHFKHHPSAPPCPSLYESYCAACYPPSPRPHGPLCFKEIEVKSTGTQSDRKISILQKIKEKIQPQTKRHKDVCNHSSSQTTSKSTVPTPTAKPFFSWKRLQAKTMQGVKEAYKFEPVSVFPFKAQQKIAASDKKIRKAMVKKLFNTKNPFAARNMVLSSMMNHSTYGPNPLGNMRLFA